MACFHASVLISGLNEDENRKAGRLGRRRRRAGRTSSRRTVNMVHVPDSYAYDFWTASPKDVVELSCFMPTGVFIPLEVKRNATLIEIKEVRYAHTSRHSFKTFTNARFLAEHGVQW